MIEAPFESLDELLALLRAGGDVRYSGEPVTHWEHASQTAALSLDGIDDQHEIHGTRRLESYAQDALRLRAWDDLA